MTTFSLMSNLASVSVKTAGYTIPADRVARAVVEVDSGGIFTINAVNAMTSSPFLNLDISTGSSVAIYNVPTGYKAKAFGAGNSITRTLNGNQTISDNGLNPGEVGPGGQIRFDSSSGNAMTLAGVAEPSNATHRQGEFFLPPGTIIGGSGSWRAVVEEYFN